MSLTTQIINCNNCKLRGLLDVTFTPLCPEGHKYAKIALIKFMPSFECHLESSLFTEKEKILIEKLCKVAKVPEDEIYTTSILKCFSEKTTGLKPCIKECSKFLNKEIKHRVPVFFGAAAEKYYRCNNSTTTSYIIPSLSFLYRCGMPSFNEAAECLNQIYLSVKDA